MSEEYEDTKEEHYVALYIIFDIQQAYFLHEEAFGTKEQYLFESVHKPNKSG